MKWLPDAAARRQLLAEQAGVPLVSAEMPLRANLAVIENIALVPQYTRNLSYRNAVDVAWNLMLAVDRTEIAYRRDPALDHADRFVAKLLRAVVCQPPLLLIDRPALMLPDIHYPPFVHDMLTRLGHHLDTCWILDYTWNKPLYPPPSRP